MDNEINEIIKKYKYDQKTRKYSNKHYYNDYSINRDVKCNNDVKRITNGLVNLIAYYDKFNKKLVNDDIFDLEIELAKYEIAIHKVLQCYDDFNFKYSPSELLELIYNWDKYEEQISNIYTKKAYQD